MGTSGPAPAHLGRYELVARLASGGMGEIFLARLEGAAGFEKLCVIKRILPHLADDPRFRQMLIGEARIASMMTHSNICQVHELGETDGQLYIVMEYLEGVTLLPLLRKMSKEGSRLDLGFIGGVLQQATDGLHYAHELKDRSGASLGIVHRDVTPSNLFLTESGVVKVLDFGIAKVKDASAQTQTGTVKGKYAYMAPEQLRGAAVDRRVDVFALGVAAYEMLALRRLFQRKTDYLTFRAVLEQPIIDIRTYRPDCPDALATVLMRALDRDPDQRFATARQFGAAVHEAVAPIRRPWSQGEIGDYVCASFADDIKQRSAQITSAVRTVVRPEVMPLIVQADEQPDLDETQEFPSVDSGLTGTPVDARHIQTAGSVQTFHEPSTIGTALDASVPDGEARTSARMRIATTRTTAPEQAIVADRPDRPDRPDGQYRSGQQDQQGQQGQQHQPHRRSVIWPLLAIAMVMIAAGALFLVWRQTQNPPQTLVIEGPVVRSGSSTLVVGDRADEIVEIDGGSDAEPATAPVAGPSAGQVTPGRTTRPTADPYQVVVRGKRLEVNRCVTAHGAPPPGTRLLLLIAPDGRPKTITLEPASVDTTELGDCIKGVFEATSFPRGKRDFKIEVTLSTPV